MAFVSISISICVTIELISKFNWGIPVPVGYKSNMHVMCQIYWKMILLENWKQTTWMKAKIEEMGGI